MSSVAWSRRTLSSLSETITKGTTPTSVGFEFTGAGVPFVRVQDLVRGIVDVASVSKFISLETNKSLSRSVLRPNDVLLSIAGTVGRIAIVPSDAPPLNCNQAVAIVRPLPGLDERYLAAWLATKDAQAQMSGRRVTGTISNLSLKSIGGLQIPLPPIEEQRRIAAVLDAADELRTKRRQALAKVDTLTQSIFIDMFGDPMSPGGSTIRLGSLTSKIGSGATPRGGSKSYKKEGIPLVRSMNVRDGSFDATGLAHIDGEQARLLDNACVEHGDVLVNITGASVARVCRAPEAMNGGRVNQHVAIVRPNRSIDPWFLEVQLMLRKAELLRIGGAGATREAITKSQLENLAVLCPGIDVQLEFRRACEAADAISGKHRRSVSELDTLFASLQQRAFAGQL